MTRRTFAGGYVVGEPRDEPEPEEWEAPDPLREALKRAHLDGDDAEYERLWDRLAELGEVGPLTRVHE